MKKKILAAALSLCMVASIAGCGGASSSQAALATNQPSSEPTSTAGTTFPSEKAIKLIVPYDAGGGVDLSARIIASTASEFLNQRVDVVCMSGAGGQEGINYVLDQPSDGYTLLVSDYGPLISTALQEDVRYHLDDFTPVIEINQVVPTFFVNKNSPYLTIEALIEGARSNPGKISVAHGKYLSVPHLPLILLEKTAEVSFAHVPTTGGSEALAFVLGNKVNAGGSVPSTIAGSVSSGDLIALAVASDERIPAFPDTPTFKELGYDVVMPAWYTIFSKSDVPAEVREALEKGLQAALASDSAQQIAAKSSIDLTARGSADSLELYHTTIENLTTILAEAN